MVFRHAPKEIRCQGCADSERIFYRPSGSSSSNSAS